MPWGDGVAIYGARDRYQIPRVTLGREEQGCPAGLLNIEGGTGMHEVWLVPDAPTPRDGLIMLIASSSRFWERTTPPLIAQLRAAGCERSEIKVAVNESDRDTRSEVEGVEHVFTSHAGWEFSALHAATQLECARAFMLHDTCRVEAGFLQAVLAANGALPWSHQPACVHGRTGMGLYSHEYLAALTQWLATLDGVTKPEAILAECAAELIQRAPLACAFGAAATWAWERGCERPWGTETLRSHRVCPHLDLHKFTTLSLQDSGQL